MDPKILSQRTADALEILVDMHGYDPALKTTAFFCRKMGRAYDLLASRNRKCALSMSKPDKLNEALEQIDEFYEIVETMKFRCPRYKKGKKYFVILSRKPFKWGMLLTITSTKKVAMYLLKDVGFGFVLCGKLGTEAVENLFSSVRIKKKAPSALEFKYIIRALMIVKFMKPPKGASYGQADESNEMGSSYFLTEFKQIRKEEQEKKEKEKSEKLDDYAILTGDYNVKDYSEETAFCLLIGYLLLKTICTKSKCKKCISVLKASEQTFPEQDLITKRSYEPGAMVYPTRLAYDYFSLCNSVFHKNFPAVHKGGTGLKRVMDHLLEEGESNFNMPVCHLELMLERFFKINMIFEARQINSHIRAENARKRKETKAKFASKSMAGHALG
jgi:hypothetical protein